MWKSLCAANSTRAVNYLLKCVNAKKISSHRGFTPPSRFMHFFPNVSENDP